MTSFRAATVALIGLFLCGQAPNSEAQFDGLKKMMGGGTSEEKPADPSTEVEKSEGDDSASVAVVDAAPSAETIEADLTRIIIVTSRALGAFNEALGLKEQAEKANANATCMEKGECGVADAVAVVQSSSEEAQAAVEARKQEGSKLSAEASKAAAEGLLPAIQGIPLWIRVSKGGQALMADKMQMLKARKLAKALPKVPGAMQGSIATLRAGISYLSFSGADTSSLEAALTEGTADL